MKLSKDDFLSMVKIEKPKIVKHDFTVFGFWNTKVEYNFSYDLDDYVYSTNCLECAKDVANSLRALKIKIIGDFI